MDGVPVEKMLSSERAQLLKLNELLGQSVIGQEHACQLVAEAILRGRVWPILISP